jgi:hypothetical protein
MSGISHSSDQLTGQYGFSFFNGNAAIQHMTEQDYDAILIDYGHDIACGFFTVPFCDGIRLKR